ncbi:hypothetical protein GCM10028801_12880 [Nocardioides maradonensis]
MRRTARIAARVLTGTTYAVLGFDAVRSPGGRVDMAAPLLDRVRSVVPAVPDDALAVRANGAVQTAAGAALVAGFHPRLSAVALIGSMVPTTLAGHAFWEVDDKAQRAGQRTQFLKNAAMIGGLIAIALDRGDS